MNHYAYVLLSIKDRNFYSGYTNELQIRLTRHRKGKVFSTKSRLPVKLMDYQACDCERDARAREKYSKSGMGKRYFRNRLKHQLINL